MIRKPIHKLFMFIIILWCSALVVGAILWAFMGMMFAGEPAGGGIGLFELMLLAAPFGLTAALTTALITLWRRGLYVWAVAGLILSAVFVGINFYGYVL